ncbi:hypothetical protein, partial [Mycobacterium sp. E2699]|uniref:hypothetical protein n=1 Tax=Mycobacterium sp. E2699 TaxID=1834137 RepID=UPI0018D2B365
MRAPGLSGNRYVELGSWVRKEVPGVRSFRVFICSISPAPWSFSSCPTGGAGGGAGYMAENRLIGLRGDTDVFTTFE